MKILIASGILSLSLIISAALVSGNIDFKKHNIINTDSGHVNLGKVYNERALVDVTLRFSEDRSLVFDAEDLSIGSYMDEVEKKLQSMLDSYNKDKSEFNKITRESMSFRVPVTLTLKTHIQYNAENIPMFNLILKRKEIQIDANTTIHSVISDELSKFIDSQREIIKTSYFIKGNKE